MPVDLIDNYTTDVFSVIEGTIGYNIDVVSILPGLRILFVADTDPMVYGKIYQVTPLRHLNTNRLVLIETPDSDPQEGECVLVTHGTANRGKMFHFSQGTWRSAQEKTKINQK
jgi:hypothetical protein